MIEQIRGSFNASFSDEQYRRLLQELGAAFGREVKFRVAETPVFVPAALRAQLLEGCEDIFDTLARPDFVEKTRGAIASPEHWVPNEDPKPLFIQVDFGICSNADGTVSPQLIEIQGFPSLYCFQVLLAETFRKVYEIPSEFQTMFGGLDREQYLGLMREAVVGGHRPEEVVLLEVEPEKQGTNIDFYATEAYLGVKVLDLQDLRKDGRELYYLDGDRRVRVRRIYNRVIFDELDRRDDLTLHFKFTDDLDVEWAGHPNWFFRLSKYSLPLFKSKFVPETNFLHELEAWPDNLADYVLKPLFSFAGQGVKINVTREDLDSIPSELRSGYILQRKVQYAPVVETPDGPAKCEIRMMALWLPEWDRPRVVNNICRLSKGEMVGVRYNKDKTWVGGTVCFFEP